VLRALDSLIAAGFAARFDDRFDDRFDRRRVVVELTNAGASAMKQCLLNSRSLAELI
jgi:DNA-binding MarR family transcriptional regulator